MLVLATFSVESHKKPIVHSAILVQGSVSKKGHERSETKHFRHLVKALRWGLPPLGLGNGGI